MTTLAKIPFTATWNGAVRSYTVTSSSYPYGTVIAVSLTADDVAISQLGQFALYDARNNTLIGSLAVPVVYPVSAQAVLYDSPRGRVYLSTGGAGQSTPPAKVDPRFPPNSLISIDIQTGAVLNALNLNAAGGALALSDDDSALYVSVAPSTVRRVDPATFAAVSDFQIPSGGTFGLNIKDLAVMPGTASTVALQYYSSNATGTTFGIFDNGVPRPNTLGNGTAAFELYSRMLFSPDGKYLFLGNAEYFPSSTDRYLIDSNGFVQQTRASATGGAPISIIGNTLYTAPGISMNWQTMQVTGNLGGSSVVVADPVNSRILATFPPPQYANYQAILQAFDLASQVPLGTMKLPLAPVNLYRFGSDGLILQATNAVLFFHTPLAGPAPALTPNGIVNAGSYLGSAIAPGEVVSIFGSSLGPANGASFSVAGKTVESPPGVEVWFGRAQGTVLFASPNQINVAAPFELIPGSTVEVQVLNNGIASAQSAMGVVAAAPALLTRDGSGKGLVAMINQDGTFNSPAPAGSVVSLFGTGGGTYPGATDGVLATKAALLNADVQVIVSGQNAQVLYAGAAPSLVSSAFQINVQIPPGTAPGSAVPIALTIGGQRSPQEVTIEVR